MDTLLKVKTPKWISFARIATCTVRLRKNISCEIESDIN